MLRASSARLRAVDAGAEVETARVPADSLRAQRSDGGALAARWRRPAQHVLKEGGRMSRRKETSMKTQIAFKRNDGSDGVALVNGNVTDPAQAKQALADQLSLPAAERGDNSADTVDARLRLGGIDPQSVKGTHISE